MPATRQLLFLKHTANIQCYTVTPLQAISEYSLPNIIWQVSSLCELDQQQKGNS